MAIDSASKRHSAMTFNQVAVPAAPRPSGSVGDEDRAHLLHLYSGLAAEEPVMSAFGRRQRTRRVMAAFYEEAA